jgi:hypothetical protein
MNDTMTIAATHSSLLVNTSSTLEEAEKTGHIDPTKELIISQNLTPNSTDTSYLALRLSPHALQFLSPFYSSSARPRSSQTPQGQKETRATMSGDQTIREGGKIQRFCGTTSQLGTAGLL